MKKALVVFIPAFIAIAFIASAWCGQTQPGDQTPLNQPVVRSKAFTKPKATVKKSGAAGMKMSPGKIASMLEFRKKAKSSKPWLGLLNVGHSAIPKGTEFKYQCKIKIKQKLSNGKMKLVDSTREGTRTMKNGLAPGHFYGCFKLSNKMVVDANKCQLKVK